MRRVAVRVLRRTLLILIVVLGAWGFTAPTTVVAASASSEMIHVYAHDNPCTSVASDVVRLERGPPLSCDHAVAYDAIDRLSWRAPASSGTSAVVLLNTYDSTVRLAHVDSGKGVNGGYTLATGGDPSPLFRGSVAAETAAKVCSFAGATTVLMADGTKKPIEEIEPGDKVIATDPETGEQVAKTVEHVFVHDDTVVDLVVDGEVITTTEDHTFWSVTDQRFERADELAAGEKVLGADRRVTIVSGLKVGTERSVLAYNLSVEGIHTYHVGESEILVHNSCWSIASRLKAAGPGTDMGLPSSGKIRFVPEHGYNPANPLTRGPQGGYIDRFGNEWAVGPSRTPGHPFEWDVQLSLTGQSQLGWLSRDGSHINVSPFGEVTH